jgi:hypothetical protein
MATAGKNTETLATVAEKVEQERTQWNGMEVMPLTGASITDKSTLIDVPFAITGIKATATAETPDNPSIPYVIVEANLGRGKKVWFNDSSTGVKVRCEELLQQYHDWKGEQDVWYDMPNLFCPRGLELSEYDKTINGRTVRGKTYYLTNIGGRP